MAKPKRDGTAKKEVGFRWFDEVSFTADDKARKNNWQPIENVLHAAQPDGPANGSQPIRSETNRTSSAAGSRR
jgi:hypothetical protein